MDVKKQKMWYDAIEKENRLRLNWFRTNKERLTAYAERPNARTVSEEFKEEVRTGRQTGFRNVEKYPIVLPDDIGEAFQFDIDAILNVMKPVDPEVKKLIYCGMEKKGGRVNYLEKRAETIPEEKYYFPETTNFRYGWKMWHNKARINEGNERQQIIKNSFYRRRGVERDPEWYREPASISPTTCGRL